MFLYSTRILDHFNSPLQCYMSFLIKYFSHFGWIKFGEFAWLSLNVKGCRLLQQHQLVNPPLECCEIIIWWKTFINEGVLKGCSVRKKTWLKRLCPTHRRINCMMMHLLRKVSASNSDMFGRYVTGHVNQEKVQSILSWLHVSPLDLADQAHGTRDRGTVLHTWPNGRFVQLQDRFRNKETLGPIKGAHFPWSSLGNGLYIWLPVHR